MQIRPASGMACLGAAIVAVVVARVAAQQPTVPPPPALVTVRPIAPPVTPLPPEDASASVKRFSFIAYGDTRSGSDAGVPGDGQIVHPHHNRLVDGMLAKAQALAATPFPIRFVIQSGDAVLRGPNGAMWNVSFSPIIERLTRANLSYFFTAGNHDVTGMPAGDRSRGQGVHNLLSAMARLIPPEGSPRRLSGYPTYAVGYGNTFLVAIDSNIAADPLQLAWVTDQFEHLDRTRYPHIVAFFHHPIFSSGPHGGATIEPATAVLRAHYAPLFRRHHVRLVIAGHDHLLDHWVERYDDNGITYRRDDVVTGGGGAPVYSYSSEPNLRDYLAAGVAENVRVEHLARPGATTAENPYHFLVVRVDGLKLSVEAVAIDGRPFAPYAGNARIDLDDPPARRSPP